MNSSGKSSVLPRLEPENVVRGRRQVVDDATLAAAGEIVRDVRARGYEALIEYAERLGDVAAGGAVIIEPAEMKRALDGLPGGERRVLERAAERIESFARAQRACLLPLTTTVAGFEVGHTIAPMETAGCYAPGGRFPLPSSVLMTACTARAAGVKHVWVASPRPQAATLAAASLAGAERLLAVGGAQAIAALAYGAGPVPACDVIVGPGNRWVTAAKQLIGGAAAIDMLAGPSEVLIIADDSADAGVVAADLLAQAEHDPDAAAWLLTDSVELVHAVEREVERQLASLPSAGIARQSLGNGGSVVCGSIEAAIALSDRLAPEHLEIMTRYARGVADRCRNYGAIFIGQGAAEVVGDYGLGPNHTLPTGGAARFSGGLSVLHFLRTRTFIAATPAADRGLYKETAEFARIEGLEAHARAALARE